MDTITPRSRRHDSGFTLVEILIVIVIVGVLGTVVVMSVNGVATDAEETACLADRRTLEKATEAFFAQRGTDVIPDAGGPEGIEQTLLDEEFLGTLSTHYDLAADGSLVVVSGSACTV